MHQTRLVWASLSLHTVHVIFNLRVWEQVVRDQNPVLFLINLNIIV